MKQTTIYKRVFIPFSVAVTLAAIAAWWIATTLLAQTLEQRVNNQLTHTLEVLVAGTFPFTAELLYQLAELQNMDFALINDAGEIQFSTLSRTNTSAPDTTEETISTTWRAGLASSYAHAAYDLEIKPLSPERSTQYVAVAGVAPKSHVQAATKSVALTLGGISALTILLLAWWGHRISAALTRPMNQLTTMAKNIAAGDRSQRAPTASIVEINDLSRSLDDMATSLDAYEQELAAENRLRGLGELAARVAHEIRNPLTAIKLQLQLLAEAIENPLQQDSMDRILTEVQRLELVVTSALSLGRPLEVNLRKSDLNQIIGDVTAIMLPQLVHRNIQLESRLGIVPQTGLDIDRMKQVVFNLLTNATDALPHGGRIRITSSLTPDRESLKFTIEDSGSGFDEVGSADLFVKPYASSKANGLGVGLIICKEIVDLHNGSIACTTSCDLKGASFTVTIPTTDSDRSMTR